MAKRRDELAAPLTEAGSPAAPAVDPGIAAMGYEQARDALVEVVRRLESGGATLEESLQLWERGEALATRCEQWLHGARARLDTAAGGSPAPDRRVEPDQPDDSRDEPDDEDQPD
jgi:exodeoxyribonuclease VII small subunit